MNAAAIIQVLHRAMPDAAYEVGVAADQPTIHVPREHLVETCRALRDAPDLQFSFLAELTAVDRLPSEPRFEVVYHLVCLGTPGFPTNVPSTPKRLRVKVRVSAGDAHVPTVTGVWPAAGWLEREVWDLFGIVFDGHADLRRLIMPEEWEGPPLRKDHPMQVGGAGHDPVRRYADPDELLGCIVGGRQGTASLAAFLQVDDLGAAPIAIGSLNPCQVLRYDLAHALVRLEQRLQVLVEPRDFLVFGLDLLAFQRGPAAQLHVQDRSGLELAQLVALHQPHAGLIHVMRVLDQADDLIQVLEGNQVAFKDVSALPCLVQVEFRSALDDREAVIQVDAPASRQASACSDRCRAAKSRQRRIPLPGAETKAIRTSLITALETVAEAKTTPERCAGR